MPAKKDGAASLFTRLFDPKMYVEGLRQLRVMGVLCSVILEVVVLLCCYNSARYQSIDFEATSFLVLLGVMAMTPLMTLYLFRFLNHRESCDFYHALPHPYVKHTTKIFSLRLMDSQAQAYPDARRKTRGACQLHRGGQSQSPVRPLCNRKRFS